MRIIPTITAEGVHDYFNHVIDAKLTVYENLKDTPALLELAIWKSKITEQVGSYALLTTEMKMRLRTDSITMVSIIVPNVVSFLTDDDGSNWRDVVMKMTTTRETTVNSNEDDDDGHDYY